MALSTPNSAAVRDLAYVAHPYTNLKTHQETGPVVITHGEGVRVYDENGREYIEGLAGLWCTALGFSEPRLAEAVARGLARLPYYHCFGGKAPALRGARPNRAGDRRRHHRLVAAADHR